MIIDLHIHTNNSDGILSPKEVIDVCKKNNINTISITDHDTICSYTKDLIEYAKNNNIKLISGVEISTKMDNNTFHILGYNIDINNKDLIEKLNQNRNSRHIYLHEVCTKLKELGYSVNEKKLNKIDLVSKSDIASDIVNNNKNTEILNKTFNNIPSKGKFIEEIMNEGCIAYIPKESLTPKEAATLIKNSGGVVVLAHPVAYIYEDYLKDNDILKIVDIIKPCGIESNYIYIDKDNNVIDNINYWNKFAVKHNLFTTVGSDYHISDNIRPEIGLLNYKLLSDKYTEDIEKNIIQKNNS